MSIDWKQLADEVIYYRTQKGFAPTTWADLPTRLNCINSECRELEDALDDLSQATWRSRSLCERAVRLEMADVAMYSLTVLWDMGTTNWNMRKAYHVGARRYASPSEMVRPLRRHADDALRMWRKGEKRDALVCVELVLVSLVDLKVRVLGHSESVADDVRLKIAASADRPPAHGKDPRSWRMKPFTVKNKYGARRTNGYASKREAEYASLLQLRKQAGDILDWLEQVPVKLTGGIKYTIDFAIIGKDGKVSFVEVKGRETRDWKMRMRLLQAERPEIYSRLQVVG